MDSVTIEFTNAIEPRSHASISVAIVVAACAFFFIPTTLIILGYYSSQPTGTLISPLPQGVLSEQYPVQPSPQPTAAVQAVAQAPIPAETPAPVEEAPSNAPIIAAPNESTQSADSTVSPASASNIIDKAATISAAVTEQTIHDTDIKSTSQIYLSPRLDDKAVYSVKSKADGQFVIAVETPSDIVRYVDYSIVNP